MMEIERKMEKFWRVLVNLLGIIMVFIILSGITDENWYTVGLSSLVLIILLSMGFSSGENPS